MLGPLDSASLEIIALRRPSFLAGFAISKGESLKGLDLVSGGTDIRGFSPLLRFLSFGKLVENLEYFLRKYLGK